MRFLADENLSVRSLSLLRERPLDVMSVLEDAPGLDDADVIALARQSGRVLLTFDSDIGTRIFHEGDPPPPAVIYLRFVQNDPEETARVVVSLLEADLPVEGHFVTYRKGRVRHQPLPEAEAS